MRIVVFLTCSTLAEAIMVSRDMEASYTVLTHFSKHWKIYWPRESGNLRLGPGISAAFDFMTVRTQKTFDISS